VSSVVKTWMLATKASMTRASELRPALTASRTLACQARLAT
jgi:hypothetical protein